MWKRPWRWLVALVVAVIVLGVLNQAVVALGQAEFLGLGTVPRLVVFLALAAVIDRLVPTQEEMDRGREPLPPLPGVDRFRQQPPGRPS